MEESRLNRAIRLLYKAFHNNELNAMDCSHCAVGNLCNNNSDWVYHNKTNSSVRTAASYYFGDPRRISKNFNNPTGYSDVELANIESIFITGSNRYRGEKPLFHNNISDFSISMGFDSHEKRKELQFKGLCAVIEYLCELDGVPNMMEQYQSLFEYDEEDKAVNELV